MSCTDTSCGNKSGGTFSLTSATGPSQACPEVYLDGKLYLDLAQHTWNQPPRLVNKLMEISAPPLCCVQGLMTDRKLKAGVKQQGWR